VAGSIGALKRSLVKTPPIVADLDLDRIRCDEPTQMDRTTEGLGDGIAYCRLRNPVDREVDFRLAGPVYPESTLSSSRICR
jgi:hypothetical protein